MAVTYIGGSEGYTTGQTLTITAPSGIQEGDVLVFACITRNIYIKNSGGPNEGTWTEVDGVDVYSSSITNPWVSGTNEQFGCWYKIAGDSEPSEYTLNPYTDGGTNNTVGVILVFRGNSAVTMVHAISGNTTTAPSVTLTEDNNIVIGFWGTSYDAGHYIGPPTGWDEGPGYYYDPAADVILYSAFKTLFSAGATGDATVQQTGVTDYVIAAQVGFSFVFTTDASCSFSESSGEYSFDTLIELSSTAPGATFYYTMDGTDPTLTSDVYTDPIPVFDGTLKAFAVADDYGHSDIVSATYTVTGGFISYVGGSRAYVGDEDTLTITAPSGIQEGDLIVFGCVVANDYILNSGPNEGIWTQVQGVDVYTSSIVDPGVDGTGEQFGCWYKIAGDSEPSEYTITAYYEGVSTEYLNGTILVFRGGTAAFSVESIAGNTNVAPSVTLPDDYNVVVGFFGSAYESGTIDGPPDFWTEAVDGVMGGNTILYSAYRFYPDVTTEDAAFDHTGMDQYLFASQIGFSFTPSGNGDGQGQINQPIVFIVT